MKTARRKEIADLIGSGHDEPLPPIMSAAELANLFDSNVRTVNALAARGVFNRLPNGKFETIDCVRRYLTFSRKGGNAELEAEKVRLTREQADKIELANGKERGDLIPVREVEHQWASILKDVRQGMLAVPGRIHSRLPHLTQHDISELDLEVRAALESLADE